MFSPLSALLFLALLWSAAAGRAAAPPPFYLLPLWDDLTSLNDDAEIQRQMEKLKEQIGSSSAQFKVGFSFISNGKTERLVHLAELARKNDLSLGVILGTATHHAKGSAAGKLVNEDFRYCQWRLDGKTWRGAFAKDAGTLETGESPRDWMVPTPARTAEPLRALYERSTAEWARNVAAAMKAVPGVIAVVNFSIEEELAVGGTKSDAFLADYSPFAVTEFRDWLRHRGLYDVGGKYAGQGAPAALTGAALTVQGKKVSPFFDDPTPADAHGTGQSFNQRFGTKFTTWDLASWDLVKFPQAITDPNFNPSPTEGPGAIPGGFDAPRTRGDSPYWKAWSWDYHDRGHKYPPGHPTEPAYGFRQYLTRNFVQDLGTILQREGIPAVLLYAHQIPGELWNPERDRSSASTIWSGLLAGGSLGITYFSRVDVAKVTPYSQNWGIFEWHPQPNRDPQGDELYRAAMEHLELYYGNHARVLFPGWWRKDRVDKTFPLNDSKFAAALKDWLAKKQAAEPKAAGTP